MLGVAPSVGVGSGVWGLGLRFLGFRFGIWDLRFGISCVYGAGFLKIFSSKLKRFEGFCLEMTQGKARIWP